MYGKRNRDNPRDSERKGEGERGALFETFCSTCVHTQEFCYCFKNWITLFKLFLQLAFFFFRLKIHLSDLSALG